VVLCSFFPPADPPRTLSIALFQETQEGQLAIVHCTVESHPPSALSLYRDETLLATTSTHTAPNRRISITATHNSLKLEIQKVVPEDEGEYRCLASNAFGNATTTRFFGAQTARVFISPSAEIREGQEVTLTCIATLGTEERTSYTWYKNAKWLKESHEATLLFPAVTSGDAGTFHCKTQNSGGSNTSPAMPLRVLYPPKQPVISSFLETQEGQLGVLQCRVDSDPASELALYRGDELVASTSRSCPASDPRVTVTPSRNGLRVEIHGVALEDEGRYVCSAQNSYGNASASMD
uniref:Ig-like domain-containing protein n=1 Tax=Sphenodon punctatus TaxID=8508 RepID=A0A8D0LAI3_SPHPU